MPALRTHGSLMQNNRRTQTAMTRLSTGKTINHAACDPSGLAIANRMRREVRGLGTNSQNALDGISFIQTADGVLVEKQSIASRLRELVVYAANETMVNQDRAAIQLEIDELIEEMDRITRDASFNNRPIFSGAFTNEDDDQAHVHGIIRIRIGSGNGEFLNLNIPNVTTNYLGIRGADGTMLWSLSNLHSNPDYGPLAQEPFPPGNGVIIPPMGTPPDVIPTGTAPTGAYPTGAVPTGAIPASTVPNLDDDNRIIDSGQRAMAAIDLLDAVITDLSRVRAQLGAYEARLERTSSIIETTRLTVETALSRVVDADLSREMTEFTTRNVLTQASVSILAMANQKPQQLLTLLSSI